MRTLYGMSADQTPGTRNPVIVIPGILGSRLRHRGSDRIVWGAKNKAGFAQQENPEEARQLSVPMREGAPLSELSGDIEPDGTLDRLRASRLGLSLEIRAYDNILQILGASGYLETVRKAGRRAGRHVLDYGPSGLSTCFQFDYDWRRSLPDNAALLAEFVQAVSRFAGKESGCGPDVPMKVDIVAHSMGGLLLRYFLRYGGRPLHTDGEPELPDWSGADYVEHAMIVGTPNAGSLDALDKLINGLPGNPTYPRYDAAFLGTMPAVYQLLPRCRHRSVTDERGETIGDLYDPGLWSEMRWGLANPDADALLERLLPEAPSRDHRLAIAADHLAKCLDETKRFHAAIDLPAVPPTGLVMQLFAGDGILTPSRVAVGPTGTPPRVDDYAAGDATVLRSSALMDERIGTADPGPRLESPIRWDNVTFIPTGHMALTKHPTFVNNALYLLLEKPRPTCNLRHTSGLAPAHPESAPADQLVG